MALTLMGKAVAFCPAHITGLFEIRDNATDPLRRGSRGAGVCLSEGVRTEVVTTEKDGIDVLINGELWPSAKVSRAVAERLLAISPSKRHGIQINHEIEVPIASGFGTSGAAAIGVALAGAEALQLDLSSLQAYQLAHTVEVELKTGLGTVAGDYCGGLEVRAKEGAPGYGSVFQVPLNGQYSVVALHNGPLQTNEFLSSNTYRARINSIGRSFSDEIIRTPKLETFLRLSHEFSAAIGLGNNTLLKVMSEAKKHGYLFGMAMFGQTVFTIVKDNEATSVSALVSKIVDDKRLGKVIISPIDPIGGRLEEESLYVTVC